MNIQELKESTSMHAQQLYNLISSQINDAEREYSPDGQVVIKIVRSSAQSPKPPSAPIYGAIIGCCGRAPFVHYFRDGQRCCPDGQVYPNDQNLCGLMYGTYILSYLGCGCKCPM